MRSFQWLRLLRFVLMAAILLGLPSCHKKKSSTASGGGTLPGDPGGGGSTGPTACVTGTFRGSSRTFYNCSCSYSPTGQILYFQATKDADLLIISITYPCSGCSYNEIQSYIDYTEAGTLYRSHGSGYPYGYHTLDLTTFSGTTIGSSVAGSFSAVLGPFDFPQFNATFSCKISSI